MDLCAVNTPIGVFNSYRDSIILHRMEMNKANLSFFMNVNGRDLTLPPAGKEQERFDFLICFTGVVSFFNAEYDTYEALRKDYISNFDEVVVSEYIKKMPIRKDWPPVRHYRLWTYDDVFDILASGYSLEIL